MNNDKNVVIKRTREVITYAELWHISDHLLKSGQETPRGSALKFMASIVFTAFTLEAYLNHIGPKILPCWNDIESLSPNKKLNIIAELLKVEIAYGKRPWQTMKYLFRFRNDIAHGKSTVIHEEEIVSLEKVDDEPFKFAKTSWEKYGMKQNNAIQARKDVEKIITTINKAAGFNDAFIMGLQMRT